MDLEFDSRVIRIIFLLFSECILIKWMCYVFRAIELNTIKIVYEMLTVTKSSRDSFEIHQH